MQDIEESWQKWRIISIIVSSLVNHPTPRIIVFSLPYNNLCISLCGAGPPFRPPCFYSGPEQTNQTMALKMAFPFLSLPEAANVSSTWLTIAGVVRCIHLVPISNITTRCLHTVPSTLWDRAFPDLLIDFSENKKNQETDIYKCGQLLAAWFSLRTLLGLGGGMYTLILLICKFL